MDPVTHAAAGTAIAYAAFRPALGTKATLVAALVAMSPDIDIGGEILRSCLDLNIHSNVIRSFFEHRAATHSFLYQAAAAPVLGWLAWRWSGRKGHWGLWILLAALALWSHTLLDLCTAWGTQAWLPFSAERVAWGAWPLVTVGVMVPLEAAYVMGWRAWGTHDAAPEAAGRRRLAAWMARAAIVWSIVYLAWF